MDEATLSAYLTEVGSKPGVREKFQEDQHTFAEEAFNFLTHNAHLWIEYPNEFIFKHTLGGSYTLFIPVVGQAVVTASFIKRIHYKHFMIPKLDELASPECYERLIMEHTITKDLYYYFNYLEWISFIYTLTMFCYKEGYDYFQLGQQCLARYSDIVYFHVMGGWNHLNQAAEYILFTANAFSAAIWRRGIADENTVRLLKARKKHERRYRYETNKWINVNSEVLNISDVKENLSAKFRVASALDSRRVVSGYKVVINNESSDMLKRDKGDSSKKDEQTFASETHGEILSGSEEAVAEIASSSDLTQTSDQEDLSRSSSTECNESENISGRVGKCDMMIQTESRTSSSVSRDDSSDSDFELDKNMVFIISQRFLTNTDAIVDQDYVHQRGIKICSPSTNSDHLIGNLEILGENIKNKNFHPIADEVLVVCPPGCDYEDEDTTVMVLDTSTEEEDDDDEFDSPPLYFMQPITTEQLVGADGSQPQLGVLCSEISQSPGMATWSITESARERQLLPLRSTGAISKVKKFTQPKTGCRVIEDLESLESDSESSQLTLTSSLGGETGSVSSASQMESTSDLSDQQQLERPPTESSQGLPPDFSDLSVKDK